MSNISKRRKEGSRTKIKSMGDHKEFLKRITKTLYYGQLPTIPCLSLPVTEVSCWTWSAAQRGRSVRRLHADAAARIARTACVSPCALVLAVLYLERLRKRNPNYLLATPPTELFLVSLMVGNKFLQDDGEDDEVICSEWAASGGLELNQLKKLEVEFLNAIEWNVYVSDKSFEVGLQWLERQVALRQATAQGFFTYSDLAALGDLAAALAAARALAAGTAAAALGYAGLLAVLGSALLAATAALPALGHLSTALIPKLPALSLPELPSAPPPLPAYSPNATADLADPPPLPDLSRVFEPPEATLKCCTRWLRYQDEFLDRRSWPASAPSEWRALEPWWSRTSVVNWLSPSSLVDPLQRWLERMNEYGELWAGERGAGAGAGLPLGGFPALIASVSDR